MEYRQRDPHSEFLYLAFSVIAAQNIAAGKLGVGGEARDGGLSAAAPLTLE